MTTLGIGAAAIRTGLAVDTLRYYERIGLLRPGRDAGGRRRYGADDLARLTFVRRAQTLGFSLSEIAGLLEFRHNPAGARDEVRRLAADKLEAARCRVEDAVQVRNELQLLINLCIHSEQGCPILEELERRAPSSRSLPAGATKAPLPRGQGLG